MTSPAFSDTTQPDTQHDRPADDWAFGETAQPDDDNDDQAPVMAADPAAPYGRFKNGKPRSGPAGYRSSGPKKAKGPAAPRKRPTSSGPRQPKKPSGPDYFTMSHQVVSDVAGITQLLGTVLKQPAVQLDAVTTLVFREQLAQISADFAADDARWAGALERITSASKWSGPVAVGMGFLAQIGVNHGWLPSGLMGTRDPEEVAKLGQQIMEAEREAAEAAAHDRRGATA